MKNGKKICETLKQIRLNIARANGIEYTPCECNHEGDCAGTCPACDSELMYLEQEIAKKRFSGKAAVEGGSNFTVRDSIGINNTFSDLTDNSDIKNEPIHE